MLLLVRSADDVRSAVKAASEFLVYQRQRFEASPEDEVLGIWLKNDLDAELPTWLSVDRARGAGITVEPCEKWRPQAVPTEAALGIRASFSLSGVWTLCWIDGSQWRSASTSAERREAILRALVQAASTSASSTERGAFFPVFPADDPTEHVDAAVRELSARYPDLIGARWFRDDRVRGIVPPEPPVAVTR